jgi:streptogramin lyase
MYFASTGDLWTIGDSTNALYRYSPSQLTVSGNPTPASTLSVPGPTGMAFDAQGNLWASGSPDLLFRFDSLGDGGIATAPSLRIDNDGGTLSGFAGIAFDVEGNLWVTAFLTDDVIRVDPHGLAGSVNIANVQKADVTAPSIYGPNNLAFDQSGDMWVISTNSNLLSLVTAVQLDGGGNINAKTIDFSLGAIHNVAQFQFNPPALGLGLYP